MKPTACRPTPLRSSIRLVAATALLGLVGGVAAVLPGAAAPSGGGATPGAQASLSAGATSTPETETPPPVPPAPEETPEPETLRIVQANIKTGMAVKKFSADVANVMAQQPDFITFNEVHHRSDDLVVPPGSGYAMWRDTANRYRAETPVAWRTDTWTPLEQGTHMLSNWRGVPKGKQVELGRRFANWVTLTSTEGRIVSVVSVHLAPETRGMPDLRRPGVSRLVTLVDSLAAKGPVLVGGDFNFHYGAAAYPADLLALGKLEPTFATLGSVFPTGDKRGATIDYVFNRGEEQLTATGHYPVELHSDHDAVVADMAWTVDLPVTTVRIVSNPHGTPAERRAAARELRRTVVQTAPGGRLEVHGADLRHVGLFRALRAAASRGVKVDFVTRTKKLTKREKKLRAHLRAHSTPRGSSFKRCGKACRVTWRASGAAQGTILVTPVGLSQPTLRVDVSRKLNPNLVRQRTTVVRHTGAMAIAQAARSLPKRRR